MRRATLLLLLFLAAIVVAQDTVYVCPMDPDVRSNQPGFCPRCGMKLAAGLPDPAEYRMDLAVTPHLLRAGQKVKLGFTVRDPWKGLPVTRFQVSMNGFSICSWLARTCSSLRTTIPLCFLAADSLTKRRFPRRACTGCWRIFIRMAPRRNWWRKH